MTTNKMPLDAILELLKQAVGRSLGQDHEIPIDRGFMELGLDSLELLDLGLEVEEKTGVSLEPEQLFEYSTIETLAGYLNSQMNPELPQAAIGDETKETLLRDEVAIIGMACRFPGGINNPDDLWQLLINGEDALSKPVQRAVYKEEKGGFLEAIEYFDAAFFGISPREAVYIDPQQRMLLELIWDALQQAGIKPESLKDSNTGVYIGISNNDYRRSLTQSNLPPSLFCSTGNATSVASGRISYLLGLTGPSISIDTACSSSLVAAHLACQAIKNGECELAIVAGVNLILEPTHTNNLSAAGMLSSDGRCKSFDISANGFVRSEGGGVVILARADSLLAANPLAIIKGSAINQDGHSSGLSAPSIKAQQEVISTALHKAGVNANEVDYIEAHGSGTSIGDTIELNAIKRSYTPRERPLHIGSIKASIGHAEAVSGIAGLIKTTLSLTHQQLPKQLHYQQKNKHIKLTDADATILQEATPWVRGKHKRIAGISSFGFSGTNCHMIVAEPAHKYTVTPYKGHPYQREYFWVEEQPQASNKQINSTRHPLLHNKMPLANGEFLYMGNLQLTDFPYLRGHDIFSHILFPGAAFCELLMAVAIDYWQQPHFLIEQFELSQALIITEDSHIAFQLMIKEHGNQLDVKLYAKNQSQSSWTNYCKALIKPNALKAAPLVSQEGISGELKPYAEEFYDTMNRNGIHYGTAFQVIKELRYADKKVEAHLEVNQTQEGLIMHPTLLDGCFQTAVAWAFLSGQMQADDAYLPLSIQRMAVYQAIPTQLKVTAEVLGQSTAETMYCNVTITNMQNEVIANIEGLLGKRASRQSIERQLSPQKSAPAGPKKSQVSLAEILKNTVKKRQLKIIKDFVRLQVSEVLDLKNADDIDMDRGFFDMGMDSIMLLDLQMRVQDAATDIAELNRTAGFDFPTPNALADKIYSEFLTLNATETTKTTVPATNSNQNMDSMSVEELIMKIDDE